MTESEKKLINRVQIIIYALEVGLVVILYVLDSNKYIELRKQFVFIILAFILIPTGVFGFINNEVALKNAKPLEYNKNTIYGKITNVTIIVIGVVSLVAGVFMLIK